MHTFPVVVSLDMFSNCLRYRCLFGFLNLVLGLANLVLGKGMHWVHLDFIQLLSVFGCMIVVICCTTCEMQDKDSLGVKSEIVWRGMESLWLRYSSKRLCVLKAGPKYIERVCRGGLFVLLPRAMAIKLKGVFSLFSPAKIMKRRKLSHSIVS